jgi:hypothetical protein
MDSPQNSLPYPAFVTALSLRRPSGRRHAVVLTHATLSPPQSGDDLRRRARMAIKAPKSPEMAMTRIRGTRDVWTQNSIGTVRRLAIPNQSNKTAATAEATIRTSRLRSTGAAPDSGAADRFHMVPLCPLSTRSAPRHTWAAMRWSPKRRRP